MRTFFRLLLALYTFSVGCFFATLPTWADLQTELRVSTSTADKVAPTEITEKEFISTAERYLIGFVVIIAIGVFLWIGYNMLTAEGDPDQFKKAQKALTYAIIGLAVIPLAYTIVKVIISINF